MKINHKMDASWQARFKSEWRKSVLYNNELKSTTKLVAVATLEDYNRTDPKQVGTTFNSAEGLGAKIGVNEKTVRNAWNELRKAGYLHSLGRSSGGRGVYIHRFDMPDEVENIDTPDEPTENSPVNGSGQTGKIVRSDRADCPMEQEELNKRNYQVDTYISSCQHEPDLSFDDPHVDTFTGEVDWGQKEYQGRDNGNWEYGSDPVGIDFFIETEEPQRRDEFIDYWATVSVAHGNPHTYITVRDLFIEQMRDKNRSHWGGTFMSAMKTVLDPVGVSLDDGYEYGLWNPGELEEMTEPEYSFTDLQGAWVGNDDRPQEFRKAWERGLLAGHEPIHIIAVGASGHVSNKYPRELGDVLTTLPKYKRSKAVASYRRATLT